MISIIGIVIVLGAIAGGYMMEHGKFAVLLQPAELVIIFGAAVGTVVIANPTMPIGPHHGNLTPPILMLQYFHSRRIQIYLDFILNLVDVRDVAAGLVLAMERGQMGHRYILGGEDLSLRKLLYIMAAITGDRAPQVPVPAWIAQTIAAIVEFVADHVTHRPPAATVEGVRIAVRFKALSIEKARRELGYAPRPIGPALREAILSVLGGSQQTA